MIKCYCLAKAYAKNTFFSNAYVKKAINSNAYIKSAIFFFTEEIPSDDHIYINNVIYTTGRRIHKGGFGSHTLKNGLFKVLWQYVIDLAKTGLFEIEKEDIEAMKASFRREILDIWSSKQYYKLLTRDQFTTMVEERVFGISASKRSLRSLAKEAAILILTTATIAGAAYMSYQTYLYFDPFDTRSIAPEVLQSKRELHENTQPHQNGANTHKQTQQINPNQTITTQTQPRLPPPKTIVTPKSQNSTTPPLAPSTYNHDLKIIRQNIVRAEKNRKQNQILAARHSFILALESFQKLGYDSLVVNGTLYTKRSLQNLIKRLEQQSSPNYQFEKINTITIPPKITHKSA